jgi:hypothetical protein
MRKLLFAAALSLAGVGLTTGQASAWLFHHCHRCCVGSATLCITPYNAFSPTCFGTVTCNGCTPLVGGCGPAPNSPWGWGCCAPCGGGPACCGTDGCASCGAAGYAQMPSVDGSLPNPYAALGLPGYQMRAPVAGAPGLAPQAPAGAAPPVQATGWGAMYQPGYNGGGPMMPIAPPNYVGYWGTGAPGR